jgi:hypothetical protein
MAEDSMGYHNLTCNQACFYKGPKGVPIAFWREDIFFDALIQFFVYRCRIKFLFLFDSIFKDRFVLYGWS